MFENIDNCEYVAIKPVGFERYIWFKVNETKVEDGTFTGKGGWGKGGALTSISLPVLEIRSIIYSNSPQYSY